MPYFWQRSQGRDSSQRLHAAAQLVHCGGGGVLVGGKDGKGSTYGHFDLFSFWTRRAG